MNQSDTAGQPPEKRAASRKKTYRNALAYLWGEWVRPIGEAVIIAVLVTTFLFTTVGVQGSSDMPNVRDTERVFIPRFETWLHRLGVGNFSRGDLVVLKPPKDSPQSTRPLPLVGNFFPSATYRPYFIKRIVGLAGDRVRLDKGILFVNGARVNESHTVPYWKSLSALDTDSSLANTSSWRFEDWTGLSNAERTRLEKNRPREYTVPKGHYFVMGDNRSIGGSEDSRVFGPVPLTSFSGRATFVWWPPVFKATDGTFSFNMRTLPRPEGFRALER